MIKLFIDSRIILKNLDTKLYNTFFPIFLLLMIGAILEFAGIALLLPLFHSFVNFSGSLNDYFIFEKLTSYGIDFESINFNYILYIVIFFFIFRFIFMIMNNLILNYYFFSIQKKIQLHLFEIYSNLPYSQLSLQSSSEIFKNIYVETSIFTNVYKSYLSLFQELLVILSILILILVTNFILSLKIIIFATIISFIYYSIFSQRTKWLGNLRAKIDKNIVKIIQDHIRGFKEIKILGISSLFIKDLENNLKKFLILNVKFRIFQGLPRPLIELLIVIFFAIIFLANQNNDPNIIVYALAFIRTMPSITIINKTINDINFREKSLDIVKEVLKLKKNKERIQMNKILNFKESINFKNLEFSYPDKNILKNSQIKIFKNKIHAIIGESGCGKSTLINILSGIVSPKNGFILIDNKINEKDFTKMRNLISIVSQNTFVLDNTLKFNISFKDNVDIDLFKKAIEISGIDKNVKNNNLTLTSRIGADAQLISGGQKQRMAISRALYHNKDILIFDEATNALDQNSEKEIFKKLKSLNKTIIIVSHNLSNLRYCDFVYRIKNEKIENISQDFE